MSRDEDRLQINCVTWFYLQYPKRILMAFPAGFVFGGDATKRAITGKRMKDMGYRKGTPDILIPEPMGHYHGLFIEMKTDTGKLSANQKELIPELEKRGYLCSVAHSIEDFMICVKTYFSFEHLTKDPLSIKK